MENGKTDPKESAKAGKLIYVTDKNLCFSRRRQGKGFVYLDAEGNLIKDEEELKYFKSLVIPPAWEEVQLCNNRKGHIQAVGFDAKGRKQYIYHPRWEEIRNETKFDRLYEFGLKLPDIRESVDADLRKHGYPREKVTAIIIKLLEESLIRIGNTEYAESNKSYGLTTLRTRHIEVNGSKLVFKFKGKSNKEVEVELNDKRLARIVSQIQELPGQLIFQYRLNDGDPQPIDSSDINDYIKEITGDSFTAKDFRTWGGSSHAVECFLEKGEWEDIKEAGKNVIEVVKETAKRLNNTPSVCRKYYIHPIVVDSYLDKSLFDAAKKASRRKSKKYKNLDLPEITLLVLLKANEKGSGLLSKLKKSLTGRKKAAGKRK